jgi:orotidine-5'-phosphate decarboxylase
VRKGQTLTSNSPIILAIDTPDLEIARLWIQSTRDYICGYKLGLEFFTTFGTEGVRKLREASDADLFLDLKFHDIPNTVAKAVKQVAHLSPKFLTVHASGGKAMVSAAVVNAPTVDIAAVTILTSLTSVDLAEVGFAQPPLDSAVRLAQLAQAAGARAVVCSPHEIAAVRQSVGPNFTIITPGIRPATGSKGDDQARTMTPRDAMALGATYLVIGRPITRHWTSGGEAMRAEAAHLADQAS